MTNPHIPPMSNLIPLLIINPSLLLHHLPLVLWTFHHHLSLHIL
ncbi:hypothetical protein TorRG33x02_207710 [Trema orientale]|uniref:Uncharacterized protein n=1 Tax=Trema orientale TaxID=63057 RepID=A0A2P5ECU3_TREOI|nr:hypothetical protein TorRG33x02_207710 [Trema orientale]